MPDNYRFPKCTACRKAAVLSDSETGQPLCLSCYAIRLTIRLSVQPIAIRYPSGKPS